MTDLVGDALESSPTGRSDVLTIVIEIIITMLAIFSQWEMQLCSNDDFGPYCIQLLPCFIYLLSNRPHAAFLCHCLTDDIFPYMLTGQGKKVSPII